MENRRKPAPPAATLDINCDCKEAIADYLTRAFPTRQMEEYTDDLGDVRSRPMWDEAGNPVINPQAEAARDELIEYICAMPPIPTALDALLEHYGVTAVAEVTGRSKRLVRDGSGQQRLESRSARTNLAETTAFMTGAKRILVFSDAGGTGRSYHASLDAKNQQRRVHFLLEPGWRADRAIQGLGRTHRTHQACPPLFRPVTTDCKGEARFTSTIARRLDALGALTRGQRQTGGQGMFDAADNLESDYAKHALHDWYGLLATGKLKSTTLAEFQMMSGLELTDQDGVLREDLPPIQRWLNRILAMKIAVQNAIFDEFLTLVETRVSAAKEAGTFDIGVETIAVEACEVLSDTVIRTDPVTGATSHLLELSLTQRRKVLSARAGADDGGLRGHAALPAQRQVRKGRARGSGTVAHGRGGQYHPSLRARPPLAQRIPPCRAARRIAWGPVTKSEFSRLWEGGIRRRREPVGHRDHLPRDWAFAADLGGAPQGRLDGQPHRRQIRCILARPPCPRPLRRCDPREARGGARCRPILPRSRRDPRRGTWKAPHPLNFTIRTSRVNGSRRIEIVGAEAARIPELKAKGCFTEIIAYKTRVFVPFDRVEDFLVNWVS
jgi:hypothetical protein